MSNSELFEPTTLNSCLFYCEALKQRIQLLRGRELMIGGKEAEREVTIHVLYYPAACYVKKQLCCL